MANTLYKVNVDIYQFPDVIHESDENSEITIGDLHGNAMKLLFMLVKEGIATNLTKEKYQQLVAIYKKNVDDLTKEDLETFDQIISGITFNQKAIRLIGDELADRGSNDYFTLKILQKLRQQKVPVEIIISNHSIEFLHACEIHNVTNHFSAPMLRTGHAASLENLNTLIEKGLVTANEVLNIAKKAYKPYLKLISYSLAEDASEVTIFSHAGIGLYNIKQLAEKFDVNYKDSTAKELAQTFDEINHKVRTYIQQGTLHQQWQPGQMQIAYFGGSTTDPFVNTIWNRDYQYLQRPASQNEYNLVYVHGHDDSDPRNNEQHVINLDKDNILGKTKIHNSGSYTVLVGVNNRAGLMADLENNGIYTQDEDEPVEDKPVEDEPVEDEPVEDEPVENKPIEKKPIEDKPIENKLIEKKSIEKKFKKDKFIRRQLQPTRITLGDIAESFEQQLQAIQSKKSSLQRDGHDQAAKAAETLYKTIDTQYTEFQNQKIDVKTFKENCTAAISEARPELEKHRGWKRTLSYLMLTLTGLGAFYVLADVAHKQIKGEHLPFFKTDSAQKLTDLGETISSIKPNK